MQCGHRDKGLRCGDRDRGRAVKLYVGNLAHVTTAAELRQACASFGAVRSVCVVFDRETGRSRGFGFVEMESRSAGEGIIAELNGTEFQGRKLRINEAHGRREWEAGK